jgi:UDP-glucose 4-epimerase
MSGDILDPATLKRAVTDADAVVHLAALLHVTDPPPSLRGEYERVNISGTEMLVGACRAAAVRRIVYCSSIAVYGYGNGSVLTETTEPKPDTWYGRTKLEAERVVLAARDAEGRPIGTVLRLAAVYGSRLKGNYLRLVRSLSRGRFIPIGRGRNHRALVHDRDVGRAAVLAAEHPSAPGEIFNVSDGTAPTLAEIVENISAALGRRPPRIFLPAAPVRWSIHAAHALAAPLGLRLAVTPATFAKYFESVRIDSSKIRERLGFQPEYDQATGWREAIAAMQAISPT